MRGIAGPADALHRGGRIPSSGRRLLSGALIGLFIASSGCAIIPHRHPAPNPVIPAQSEPATDSLSTVYMGPPDSLAHMIVEPPSSTRPRPPRPAGSASATTQPENPVLPPPPAEKEPERSISVEMSDTTKARLETSYRTDVDSAEKTVLLLTERQLPQEDMDKLQTATGLVVQARAAFEQQDLQAAANLAHKARVLADEIASH